MPERTFIEGVTRRQLVARGGLAVAGLGLAPVLVACGGKSTPDVTGAKFVSPPGGGKEVDQATWAMFADLVAVDYAFAYDFNTNLVVTNVTDSLLRMDVDGKLLPNLATSWEQKNSTTYVYRLRDGVKFHDGSTMSAEDAAASLNRLLDPKVGSYLAAFMTDVARAQATGPLELTVTLKRPNTLWQYAPATTVGAVVPKAFLERHGKKVGTPDVGLVGTGPYQYVSWKRGQEAVIERFDDYWNADRKPKVRRFTFTLIQDEATVIEAMGAGRVDGAFNVSGRNLRALRRYPEVAIARSPSYFVHFLGLNRERRPFNDLRVRQALSYAIDKRGILSSTWANEGRMVRSPVPPAMWTFEKSPFAAACQELPSFSLDLEKAKALVREAGVHGSKATLLVSTPHQREEGVAVQEAARQIGIDLSLQTIEYGQLLSKLAAKKKDYDGFVLEWSSDYPDPAGTLYQCFAQSSANNYTNFRDASADKALSDQASTNDPQARARNLIEAQRRIVDDQSWIIFFTPFTNMPIGKRIGGYEVRPSWYWDSWAADLSGT